MSAAVECGEMVDTQILIYATYTSAKKSKDAEITTRHQTSLELLQRLPAVRVSAVAWFEFLRGLRADERKKMEPILAKVVVERFDGPIAEVANELLLKRTGSREGPACMRCLSTKNSETCPKCSRTYSAQQRLNDAIIVATAQVIGTVDTLWSYDRGVIELGRFAADCKVSQPQSSTPLFDPQQNKAILTAIGGGAAPVIPFKKLGTKADDES